MRLLTIILLTLFASKALAYQCYLTEEKDQQGDYVLYKIKGGSPAPETICRVPCKQKVQGGDYKISIVEKDIDGQIISSRPWSESATLEQEEEIKCSIDQSKRQARLDQREQERQARKARRQKIRQLSQDFKRECIEKFSEKRGRSKDFNTCLAALFKKVFGGFDELNEDALEFSQGGGGQ